MKIRDKIILYFTTTVICLSAFSLTFVYFLFAEYREEQFQQQQKDKINYTIKQLSKYKEMSENLAHIMDEQSIHDFFDEKMMVFDDDKNLIFSSIDDLEIKQYKTLLAESSSQRKWIETTEDKYDLIAVYLQYKGKKYYAISKAYDAFGYSKIDFLRSVLIGIFLFISVIITLVSLYLSNKISKPLRLLSEKLRQFDLGDDTITQLEFETSSFELNLLTNRFNELITRSNENFIFQKHTTHHISHQLKTPISILVSELERIKNHTTIEAIQPQIESQIIKAKSLGNIISVLLQISKVESGKKIKKQRIRIDELLFDIIEELRIIYPKFNFEVNYHPSTVEEEQLIIQANEMLIRQAFMNLMVNCITYNDGNTAEIKLDSATVNQLQISFSNSGKTIAVAEEKYLFKHFFRGENSRSKSGFGLGLVLTKKIIALNAGSITYHAPTPELNVFEVQFSLS
ncbi:signal transduction histidine kinase [Flavobacterium sp. 28A]|uniref:sensor histidine kinase n=1 Tax=Flavobacterium sp. 28A TaxID=2735895 RepID=UPI00157000AC|nr:HAMP domain-containing sensor histidine kinase [Flavobacterium sp. 28A]NRT16843.1 signal transduction histidine kinase [Flavobacterium sp. 28A]